VHDVTLGGGAKTTVTAERIGWQRGMTILKERVRECCTTRRCRGEPGAGLGEHLLLGCPQFSARLDTEIIGEVSAYDAVDVQCLRLVAGGGEHQD
jgi:hypothetical protein